jgi:hypothetical protein
MLFLPLISTPQSFSPFFMRLMGFPGSAGCQPAAALAQIGNSQAIRVG